MMGPTEMEQITTPGGQAPVDAAPDSYSPPPVTRPARSASAPRVESRERRWWTIALAATLLLSAIGVGLLYADDTGNQATIRSLTTQNESLTGRNQILQDQLNTTQANLTATLGELAKTKADLEHPHLTIWNVPQQIKGSSWYLAGGIPDTFTYHLKATSSGPMSVSILTLEQWAAANGCVDAGRGTTNYCMHHSGAVMSWLSVTSVSYDFHLAEGCADYVSVFTSASSITVRPNVGVTYNPASSATGACA
jgi:cell division protein FtsB